MRTRTFKKWFQRFKEFALFAVLLIVFVNEIFPQSENNCQELKNSRADKVYEKGIKAFQQRNYSEAIRELNNTIDIEPEYVDAHYALGLIYIKDNRMNLKAAKKYFLEVIDLCPEYNPYVYYHLARIYYGAGEYEEAHKYVSVFLEDVDMIDSDEEYNNAVGIQEYSAFYMEMLNNPVPFDPKPVPGISTEYDEYLPIISPDNEMALFTRKFNLPPQRGDLFQSEQFRERFMFSWKENEVFNKGRNMPYPFNQNPNEGGATLTIDNRLLFYTICKYTQDQRYFNCDICYSEFKDGSWTDIKGISEKVNLNNAWESQPSVTSDGQTIFFVSDREGGYGGYDIYTTNKDKTGCWCEPINLGPTINTAGNEKTPFIHTDSKTLYFSSDGRMGIGGYDIFFSKIDLNGNWTEPENIGYPINSFDDDVGFFVSTNGEFGYFASNKYEGMGGWDLYYFELYEAARPEKVLFLKGKLAAIEENALQKTRIELRNTETKAVTEIEIDTVTGEYVAAVLFNADFVMTVKEKGFVQKTKYISKIDPRYTVPVNADVKLEPIEVGKSYRLNDIYFDFNSSELTYESKFVIDEFFEFLNENPGLKVSIQGHTDNIGSTEDNLVLSEKRAEAVYQYLISIGVDPSRINYKGFGEQNPVADNRSEEGRSLNRRTEFVIVDI
jgi:outer membrane protein OmpA-like peptidoglycan-associated protein/tetratricopeptide (TPR) repeat protein